MTLHIIPSRRNAFGRRSKSVPGLSSCNAWVLTFAVRAAQALITDCFVIETTQLFDIRQYLVYCHGDGVHVLSGAEEELVWEPHRFLIRGAISLRARIHIPEIEWLFAPPA